GTTLDYAQQTYDQLLALGIHDQALADVLRWAP
ncbi:MAG: gamma-glutamylcyclotransferase, partial [Betaproteobacteria bacterium]|nr:gamma-glutamylcyclotransferase [Betaproteobacteria bacterium]